MKCEKRGGIRIFRMGGVGNYGKVTGALLNSIMTINIREAEDTAKFNNFVEKHPLGTIHQLCEWGEFQAKTLGRDKFWVLTIENEAQEIQATALIIRQKLPLGKSWLYCPRGPLVDSINKELTDALFAKIAAIAKQEKAIFLRFDPPHMKGEEIHIKDARKAHAHYQPESTLIVDLTLSEDEILKQMKSKGRYNIKVAKKHDVAVKESDDIETFYNIFKETTQRDHFSGHPLQYYKDIMQSLGPNRAKLFIASYNGRPLAGAIITYFGSTATYYFGASSNQNRNTMAPYLLHWHIMQDAKKRGYQEYDLFGIAPEGAKNHAWSGVTDFKLKFGGQRINYADAQEIVYQPFWYWLLKLAKRLRG